MSEIHSSGTSLAAGGDTRTARLILVLSAGQLAGVGRAADPAAPPSSARPQAAASAGHSEAPFFLGVLEEFDYEMGRTDLRPQIRIGFRHDADGWTALPDGIAGNDNPAADSGTKNGREMWAEHERRYEEAGRRLRAAIPAAASWTVCFDGKVRGQVTSVRPDTWGPRARGSELLSEGQEPPWVGGRRADEFTGFQGVPKRRPLVATTGGRCADPDRWKRVPFEAGELEARLPALRGAMRSRHHPYSEGAAALFRPRKAYASRRGDRLLMVMFSDVERPYLFHIAPAGEARLLGAFMSVIDAGDYDGDGRSEVLAMKEGNPDALVLFTSDFTRDIIFSWRW